LGRTGNRKTVFFLASAFMCVPVAKSSRVWLQPYSITMRPAGWPAGLRALAVFDVKAARGANPQAIIRPVTTLCRDRTAVAGLAGFFGRAARRKVAREEHGIGFSHQNEGRV